MSLLDRRAPHIVWAQKREMGRTPDGLRQPIPIGDPIRVRCKVEPVRDWSSAEEEYFAGIQMKDLRVIYCRRWPADLNGYVLWKGDIYETVGQPQLYDSSPKTSHMRITAQWIGKRDGKMWPSPIPSPEE